MHVYSRPQRRTNATVFAADALSNDPGSFGSVGTFNATVTNVKDNNMPMDDNSMRGRRPAVSISGIAHAVEMTLTAPTMVVPTRGFAKFMDAKNVLE